MLDPDRFDSRFESLETISEFELYRENGIIDLVKQEAPYNM